MHIKFFIWKKNSSKEKFLTKRHDTPHRATALEEKKLSRKYFAHDDDEQWERVEGGRNENHVLKSDIVRAGARSGRERWGDESSTCYCCCFTVCVGELSCWKSWAQCETISTWQGRNISSSALDELCDNHKNTRSNIRSNQMMIKTSYLEPYMCAERKLSITSETGHGLIKIFVEFIYK